MRLVAFVSKRGLPGALDEQLSNSGVTIFQASESQGHAEIMARDFGRNVSAQARSLGGPVNRVVSSVQNNRVCSEGCANALTEWIRRPDVTINEGDKGFYDGAVLSLDYMDNLHNQFDTSSDFQALFDASAFASAEEEGEP